ncbi:hypothetical protein [Breoghania sp.]|nr:hypothetical protein [Breoghania sp.]MDJ0929754.1 hypothetical protein [Breoghania sp.]
MWDDANAGKTMGSAHSMMLGLGLGLEGRSEMDRGTMWSTYESP